MNKLIHFIKYHNAFSIGVALIFVVMTSAFANEGVRNAVIGEEIVLEQGIDNSQVLSADLDNFDLALQIQNVSEDEENYYVGYAYKTLAIIGNKWQQVLKEETLIVSKQDLREEDLGLYVLEELSEEADYELRYLKEVQRLEKEKGLRKVVASVEYTGLKGLVLNVKDKVLPGYEPIVKELQVPEIVGVYEPKETHSSTEALVGEPQVSPPPQPQPPAFSKQELEQLITQRIADYLASSQASADEEQTVADESSLAEVNFSSEQPLAEEQPLVETSAPAPAPAPAPSTAPSLPASPSLPAEPLTEEPVEEPPGEETEPQPGPEPDSVSEPESPVEPTPEPTPEPEPKPEVTPEPAPAPEPVPEPASQTE